MLLKRQEIIFPLKVRENFIKETSCIFRKLQNIRMYGNDVNVLIDESGKRLFFTCNKRFNDDKNLSTKIRKVYSLKDITIEEIFRIETSVRLVNFMNVRSSQLELRFINFFELLRRKALSWGAHRLFVFSLRKWCLRYLGVMLESAETALIAHDVCVDMMSPSLIFIGGRTIIGARTIIQTHGIKSDKGYGLCYSIGPICIMDGAEIGSDCVIMPGTIIGNNCTVYSMTAVKGDICPVMLDDKLFPVIYNQREELPYRVNMSIAELMQSGLPVAPHFKKLNDKIITTE